MLTHHTATAQVTTVNEPAFLKSIVLTPAAAVATAVVRDGDGTGTIRLTLQAAANGNSAQARFDDALFGGGIHVTLTGAGALFDVESTE